jgi:hypothetical protein
MRGTAAAPGAGLLRTARTLIVTVPTVAVGTAAHGLGGGCTTVAGVLLAVTVVGGASSTQLSRERSARFFVAWALLAQALVHGTLSWACAAPGTSPEAAAGPVAVLAGHLLAAVAVGLLLRGGDARLWAAARLGRALRARAARVAAGLLPPAAAPVAAPATTRLLATPVLVVPRTGTRAQGRPARRGPPATCRP